MVKSVFSPLVGLLLAAGAALGQAPDTLPAPRQLDEPLAKEVGPSEEPHFPEKHGPGRYGVYTFEADYLLWYFPNRANSLRVAATSQPASSTLVSVNADDLSHHVFSGGQFAVGYWMMEDSLFCNSGTKIAGAEVRFFFLGERAIEFRNSNSPDLVRPFFDINNRKESEVIVAAPGLGAGEVVASAKGSLWGGEANFLWNAYQDGLPYNTCSVDLLAGFRHLHLNQEIDFSRTTRYFADVSAFPDYLSFANNQIHETESFATHNDFYGAQIGINGNLMLENVVLTGSMKLALGATHEELVIAGSQERIEADGTRMISKGALLALPSNIGRFQRNHFAQVPEFGLKIAHHINRNITLSAGVTGMYWSRILRPGDQIQRDIDITQIPNFPGAATATPTGLDRPGVSFTQSSLWTVGANVGLEFTW